MLDDEFPIFIAIILTVAVFVIILVGLGYGISDKNNEINQLKKDKSSLYVQLQETKKELACVRADGNLVGDKCYIKGSQ